jgi:hypothetical protein
MNAKLKLMEDAEKELRDLTVLKDTIFALPDNIDATHAIVYTSANTLIITIPYDRLLMARIRQSLGHAWQFKSAGIGGNGDTMIRSYINSKGTTLSFHMKTDLYGSTCKRVQIGERTVPVYQIVCDG